MADRSSVSTSSSQTSVTSNTPNLSGNTDPPQAVSPPKNRARGRGKSADIVGTSPEPANPSTLASTEDAKPSASEKMTPDAMTRLWEHGLHEDSMFNNRLNFFLVFESLFLSMVGLLRPKLAMPGLLGLFCIGICTILIWGYVQARHYRVLERMRQRAIEVFPEYQETRRRRGKWWLSNNWILTYLVPLLVALIWVWLLISALLGWI